MDDTAARGYCHAAWYKAGSPSGVDVEDLIQEYLLAHLQGLDPGHRVAEYLCQCVKQSSMTEHGQKMGFVIAAERDEGETDEEHDDFVQLENEILAEHHAERIARLHAMIDRLSKTHPDYARALTILTETSGDVPDRVIAEQMAISQRQAKHLRLHGMELLYQVAHPEQVELVMFGEVDDVALLTKTYVRKKTRYIEWMTDAILGIG